MKTFAIAAVGAALLGSVLVLPAATEAGSTGAGVAGFLDPTTGTFTAKAGLLAASAALARTGAITVTTTVQIDSAIPVDQPITCTVSLSSGDVSFSNSASGTNNVVRTGSSGKCTTTIHYIWEVAAATTLMNVSVSISTGNGFNTDGVSHNASSSFAPFAVPNTAKSLAVTLAL